MARKSNSSNSVTVVNQNDTEKVFKHKIGLVFDGGGAKGAYQIGVWRALRESGLEQYVTDVAGTSVGGLNAALFVKGDLDKAVEVWTQKCSTIDWTRIGMCLKPLIREYLGDMSFFSVKPINCFLTVTNSKKGNLSESIETTPDGKNLKRYIIGDVEYINMRFQDTTMRTNAMEKYTVNEKVLLATTALPVLCRSIKLHGSEYRDGGLRDNSPVFPLLEATQCDMIIAVHLDADADNKRNAKNYNGVSVCDYQGVSVIDISPSQETGHLFGTLDFDNEKAAWLMELGYNDTRNAFDMIVKNWTKEILVTEDRKPIYKIIETLTPEDKYRLYNECEFLVRGNYAKLNYLSEDGFGNTILRVITGGGIKAKKQILENTVALQEKMMGILVCLDDEFLKQKIQMKYIFDFVADDSDALLQEHKFVLILTDSLSKMVDNQNKQAVLLVDIIEKLNEIINHPELKDKLTISSLPKWQNPDISDIKEVLEKLKQEINSRIAALNEKCEVMKSMIKTEESKKSEPKKHRLLRVNPSEAILISENGIEREIANCGDKTHHSYFFRAIHNLMSAKQNDVLIVPASMGFKYEKVICPADYYMFLWFINTPIEKRSGRSICMLEYYDYNMYVYGYEVNSDGSGYSAYTIRENKIFCGAAKHTVKKEMERMFGVKYPDLIFRTFSTTDNAFEDRLDNRKYYTINKVDPLWEALLIQDNGQLMEELVSKHSQNTMVPKIVFNQATSPLLK